MAEFLLMVLSLLRCIFYEQTVVPYEQYYSTYNTLTGAIRPVRLKGTEPATIDYVALNGTNSKGSLQKVSAPPPQV